MASTDARPVPIKNTALRATFPILDADGDLVTGAAGLDSEVSKDGGAYADCTNEATEIGSSGTYYLDLTSTEMNADTVSIIVKTSTTDAKTTVLVLYPQESGDIKVDLQSISGTTVATGTAQLGVNVVSYASGQAPLQPTISGRTLDVNVNGEAGLDWGNIGAATTTVNLSGTTIKTATDVETDTQDIQARLPASLTVDGNIKADTLRISGTAQTARDIGASVLLSSGTGTGQVSLSSGILNVNMEQISGDAIASDNLEAALDGTGGVTISANLAGSVATLTLASAGSITSSSFANNAISGNAISTLAVIKIQQGLALATATSAIQAVTDKLDGMLVLDGSVYQYTANALELAPTGGGGSADFTVDQRSGILSVLGVPTSGTTLVIPSTGVLSAINSKTTNLPASFPANFSTLAISGAGAVTAGTVSDKSGYSLSQAFPSNFAALSITSGGAVTTTSGSFPTTSQIADAVDTKLTTSHGSGSWQQGGGGGSGLSGPNAVTIRFQDQDGNPVPYVDFQVSTQGPGRTAGDGSLAFGVVSGTYTITARPTAGVIFPQATLDATNSGVLLVVTGQAKQINPLPVVIPPTGVQSWG